MKVPLIIFFSFLYIGMYSQIGIKLSYISSDFSNIATDIEIDDKSNIFDTGFGFSLFYSYNVRGKGIVLIPDIGYIWSEMKIYTRDFLLKRISIGLPVKFYPFNLEGDCGCPDFSLRNKFFEKHFFILFSNYLYLNSKKLKSGNSIVKSGYVSGKIGLGTGISIPISEKIAFEPSLTYNWGFNDFWDREFLSVNANEDKTINFTDIEFSLSFKYQLEK